MWRQAIVLLHFILAISYTSGFEFVRRSKSPYYGVKCMDGPKSCPKSKYRSIDGSCNNVKHSSWGMPNRPYGRLLDYNYADGIHELPTMSSGKPLPSARTISRKLFPPNNKLDREYTLLTMQHGQFVTHDMSLTADILQLGLKVQPVVCCSDTELGPNATNTDRCAPIEISPDDPDFGPANIRCFDFTRTGTTYDRGCSGPDEVHKPISVVTSWMDLSLVYGSSDKQAKAIRSFKCGKLLSAVRKGQEWPPQQENVTEACPAAKSASEPCYKAGDVRNNQNPHLVSLQVTWFREHNRIASALCKLNPHWSDEKTYQEARRINIAEFQHITYKEYLPIILGEDCMREEKILYPDAKKCVNDYDSRVDPSVTDEHANGGAFRHFHSAIIGHLQLLDEEREQTGVARLSDWVNRPLLQEANNTVNFDHLVRGLTTQHEQCVDQYVDEEIFKFLFKGQNGLGIDLEAFDIQRSRDHGIQTYAKMRKYCGLKVPQSFGDLTKYCGISPKNVKILKTLYESVKDIELLVGAALEPLLSYALAGETFHCILLGTFKRSRVGDRYFYQNCEDNRFTTDQLNEIRKSSLSRLFCDNVKTITKMQPKAFEPVGPNNELKPCNEYTPLCMDAWLDQNASSIDDSTIVEVEIEVDFEERSNGKTKELVIRLDDIPIVKVSKRKH